MRLEHQVGCLMSATVESTFEQPERELGIQEVKIQTLLNASKAL